MSDIDTSRPSAARLYDYLLGGTDNYAVDRELADAFCGAWPDLAETARVNRAWAARVVRLLAESGIDQFLDIGSGLPTADNVHQVAQRVAPGCRVLYVDNDPIVLAHGRGLLAGDARTDYIEADAADAATILEHAGRRLDLTRPVGLLMGAMLHYVPEPPARVVAAFTGHLAPGSHVAISHVTGDGADPELVARIGEQFPDMHVRPAADIRAAFDGTELLEPGLADVRRWRPERDVPVGSLPLLAGVGKLP